MPFSVGVTRPTSVLFVFLQNCVADYLRYCRVVLLEWRGGLECASRTSVVGGACGHHAACAVPVLRWFAISSERRK